MDLEFVEQRRSQPREVGKSVGVGLPDIIFHRQKKIVHFFYCPCLGVNNVEIFGWENIFLSVSEGSFGIGE